MAENNKDERVMIFIDLRNVLGSIKDFRRLGAKLDFEELVESLRDGRRLVGTYVFDGTRTDGLSSKIHDELRNLGFRVITRTCYEKETNAQKEIDVAMSCEILSQAYRDSYDSAIVVSGDRDFRPAVESIQTLGKKGEVAAFSCGASVILSQSCDTFHDLDMVPMFSYAPEYVRHTEVSVADQFTLPQEVAA